MPLRSELTRQAVTAILDSLSGRSDTNGPIDLEQLASLRATFVAAGTAAVDAALDAERWVDVALTLEPLEPCWIALMTCELPRRLDAWFESGRMRAVFFMNKPPGVRLRILGPTDDVLPELTVLLDALCARDIVKEVRRVPYEPEVQQFGGMKGLDLAHRFFTFESLAVLEYHRSRLLGFALAGVEARGSAWLAPAEFSLVLLHMLFQRVTDDKWELWDLWCKMELTGRLRSGGRVRGDEPEVLRARALRDRFMPFLDDEDAVLTRARTWGGENHAFFRYAAAVPKMAMDLRLARAGGDLSWGLREILPFWVIFHWNRMGFDRARQELLSLVMSTILNPKL
jgi:thiopeptide-type bacteriocin biosynthesis protein